MRRCFYFAIMSLLMPILLCSCSTDSGKASKPIAVIVFIVLFLSASVISAVFTYKLRMKNTSKKDTGDEQHDDSEEK